MLSRRNFLAGSAVTLTSAAAGSSHSENGPTRTAAVRPSLATANELADDYVICRSTEKDEYSVWRVNIAGDQLLHRVSGTGAKFDRKHQLISIGDYILEWGPIALQNYSPGFPYRLFKFYADAKNPLDAEDDKDPADAKAVVKGLWPKSKFWGSRPDFGNPLGAAKAFDKGDKLLLVPLGSFVLNVIPTTGRGTYRLFYFDPGSGDPLPLPPNGISGSFGTIQFGHELIPLRNFVLNRVTDPRVPVDETRQYWLWSFDPKDKLPLAKPTIQEGRWDDIDRDHQLIPIGENILDWDMKRGRYRLWGFDPKSHNPLTGPMREGSMPKEFEAKVTSAGVQGHILTGIQGLRPINSARKGMPGTIDYMRTKIKHVVYYMIENRSFDHVCGWLYEKGEEGITFVGPDGPFHFQGASKELYNVDPDASLKTAPGAIVAGEKVFLEKYNSGELSEEIELDFLPSDPYHDHTDAMRQFFFDGRSYDRKGYERRAKPSMGGFVWNNGVPQVMWTYTPEQLPVLNGLAKAFAISDEWFCSTPDETAPNRAFALTGSTLGKLSNFQNNPEFKNWPEIPNRASIWKVLWANGFKDWKIYHSVLWPPTPPSFVYTYQLFLKGQIPTVDASSSEYPAKPSKYIADIDQFKKDARDGNLPKFSFLEPVWIASKEKSPTSYHPGSSPVPGEKALNEIYEALKAGLAWNETLLIITFDEHGGIFDHVPPPYAENPWPNDVNDGFHHDMMGPRVPTILVSPWIKERTLFRSRTPVSYDATSILATLLRWYGIPKARWGLGERTHHAPTFEEVFQRDAPRNDAPSFDPPYDKEFPRKG